MGKTKATSKRKGTPPAGGPKALNGSGTIAPRPNGRYQVQVTVGFDERGRQVRRTATVDSMEEAERVLTKLRAQRYDRLLAPPDRVTVEQLGYSMIEDQMAESAPRTREYTTYILTHYFPVWLRHKRVQEVTASDASDLVRSLRQRDLGTSVRSKAVGLLKRAMREAVARRIVPFSPVADYRMPRSAHSVERPRRALDRQQTEVFLAEARTEAAYAAVYLMFAFGLRRGEALGLRWRDVDFAGRRLHIRQQVALVGNRPTIGPLKTQSSLRDLNLTVADLEVLREQKAKQRAWQANLGGVWPQNDLVTTTELGTAYDPHNLARKLREIARRAGVADPSGHFGTHIARRTSITLRLREGQQAAVVARLVGHARPSMTLDRYWVVGEEDLQADRVSLGLGQGRRPDVLGREPAN